VPKCKLPTLAWHYIRWDIIRHIKKQKWYEPILNILPSPEVNNLWEYLPSNLSKQELEILTLKQIGYTFKEIQQELGQYSISWISQIYQNILKKIKEANE